MTSFTVTDRHSYIGELLLIDVVVMYIYTYIYVHSTMGDCYHCTTYNSSILFTTIT